MSLLLRILLIAMLDVYPACDGSPDDTAAIQAELNNSKHVRLPARTCIVGPLFVRSDTTIEFASRTILRAAAGYKEHESLLNIAGAANIRILGSGGAIVMNGGEYNSGEFRHGVLIQGSSAVRIDDLTSSGSGGDGFYIGAGAGHPYSENITLHHCVADHNRRNGLSIVSARNVLIEGGEFRNTIGASPESGIDIEPNGPSDRMENIRIRNVLTSRNRGGGLTIAPAGLGAATGGSISVTIDGFTSREDGGNRIGGGIRLALPDSPFRLGYEIGGEIRISNAAVIDPSAWGVAVSHWVARAPRAVFRNVSVYNPNASGAGSADFGWSRGENRIAAHSGYVVALTQPDSGAGSRRVEFLHCRAQDRHRPPAMQRVFYLHSTADSAVDSLIEGR